MKKVLLASLVSFGFAGAASAQYWSGPEIINPPIGGCVPGRGREGTCPTNKLPRICPDWPSSPSCPTNKLPRFKPGSTPEANPSGVTTQYSVF